MSEARAVIVVETQSPTGRRAMILELPLADRNLEELHDLATSAAQTAGVLTEQSNEITVRVSFPTEDTAGQAVK